MNVRRRRAEGHDGAFLFLGGYGAPGEGGVGGVEDGRRFVGRRGRPQRQPPMEGIDSGGLTDTVIAYNEVCWGDKECMLIDGDADGDHQYVYDYRNRLYRGQPSVAWRSSPATGTPWGSTSTTP